MKRKIITFITAIVVSVITSITPFSVKATQVRNYNFNMDFTLTGNAAEDIVNIAKAQVDRTGGEFGYTEEWCADFLCDVAVLAGQSVAIPADGYCPTLQQKMLSVGGYYVDAKDSKPGDILFFGSYGGDHVEIVYQNINGDLYTIGGNGGNSDNSLSRVIDHTDQNGRDIYKAIRPAYISDTEEWKVDNNYPVPIKAYPLADSGLISVYNRNGEEYPQNVRNIAFDDLCKINAVYENGLISVTYPTPNGEHTEYARKDDFIRKNSEPYGYHLDENSVTYKKSDMTEAFGKVFTTDRCLEVGKYNDKTQIIYELDSGGYKLGWIESKIDLGDDIIILQKFLLGNKVELSDKFDMNADGHINVFDLIILKRKFSGYSK